MDARTRMDPRRPRRATCARSQLSATLADAMRAMTYNMLQGGLDTAHGDRRGLLLELLSDAAPDILVLNECNGFEADGEANLRRFESRLGMRGCLARAESGYHVAILVRSSEALDFRVLDGPFAHAALSVEFRWHAYRLRVVGAHLDPFDADRRCLEVEALLSHCEGSIAGGPSVASQDGSADGHDTLLMGDLNALSPHDTYDVAAWSERYRDRHAGAGGLPDTRAIQVLEAAGFIDLATAMGRAAPTRPTPMYDKRDVPAQRIDYVFASPTLAKRATRIEVIADSRTDAASDHRPVVAEFVP